MSKEIHARRQLAAVYRLLNHFGWDDLIYSHASVKIPDTNYYLINNFSLIFDEIKASNLIKVDLEGNIIGEGKINPAGFLIHSAIYSARPDVGGIVHTHTKEGIAVSIDKNGLWPISQYSSTIINNLSYHDYTGIAVEHEEGKMIAQSLGQNNFLILKNHGLLTSGHHIGHAFLHMYFLQRACEVQVLCNYDNILKIPDKINESQRNKIEKSRKNFLHPETPWFALLRMVERLYPDYKK